MRRPLLFWCFLAVVVMAFRYFGWGFPDPGGPPNGREITITGKVYEKSNTSFYLKVQEDAMVLWQSDRSKKFFPKNEFTEKMQDVFFYKDAVRVICEYDGAEELPLGGVVTIRGTFCVFEGASNPGEFDYARYYRSCGFDGRIRNTRILEQKKPAFGWREALYRLRSYWERRLYRIFPEKEASVMAAVLLGNKSDVDSDIKALYQKNGMIHILSISGLHITLIGMGLYRLLRRLGMPVWLAALCGGILLSLYGVMTGMGVSACRAIGMYLLRMLALLWGRTYDMLTALGVMAVILVAGNPAYLENMGFLLSFGSVLGIGMFLPAIAPTKEEEREREHRYVEGRFRKVWADLRQRIGSGFRQSLLASLSVTLTTLPVQLWFSYEVPVYSVLLNLLVLPLMGVVMVAGLAAVLIPGLGILGTADILVLAWYEKCCLLFERLPFHTWNPGRPGMWQIGAYYLLWLAVVWGTVRYRQRKKESGESGEKSGDQGRGLSGELRRGRGRGLSGDQSKGLKGELSRELDGEMCMGRSRGLSGEQSRWLSRAVIMQVIKMILLIGMLILPGIRLPQGDRVTVLDVGQGDCICVQLSTGEVYLFDCGSSSRKRIGEKVLIPFLKYQGIRSVDAVFLSHADADHINGMIELLQLGEKEGIAVKQVVLPKLSERQMQQEFGEVLADVADVLQERKIPVTMMKAGDAWQAGARGEDYFLCLHPAAADSTAQEGNDGQAGNAGSLCFYIQLREREQAFSLLLTGDVEGLGEQQLLRELQERGIVHVTALKVAHHGSKGTTSEKLLEQISPKISVISCGKRNRYGHPHAETLERLEKSGTKVVRTDESGAVTLYRKADQMILRVFVTKNEVESE